MNEFLSMKPILASLIFAGIGIVTLVFSFWIVVKITAHSLWKEILEKGNVALAILAFGFLIALAMIISAAIHG